jgi:hypothetical protein
MAEKSEDKKSTLGLDLMTKRTRRREFLDEMNRTRKRTDARESKWHLAMRLRERAALNKNDALVAIFDEIE